LRRELPGILNWIIEGAELYLESGLGTVPEVDQATESYRMESDVLADFFANRCILGPTVWVGKTELWERYREYMQAIGDRDALDRHEFEAQLLQHDHLKEGVREHGTVRAWIGIAFDSKKVSHRVSMAIGDQR
jgi:putative DNA primase/helicase